MKTRCLRDVSAQVPSAVGQSLVNLTKEVSMLCSEGEFPVCFLVLLSWGQDKSQKKETVVQDCCSSWQ